MEYLSLIAVIVVSIVVGLVGGLAIFAIVVVGEENERREHEGYIEEYKNNEQTSKSQANQDAK